MAGRLRAWDLDAVTAFLAAAVLWLVYRAYYATIRKRVMNGACSPRVLPPGQNVIYVFWHSKSFVMLPFGRHRRVANPTLLDWKNRVWDWICRFYGYKTVSIRTPAATAARLKKKLEEGCHVAVPLDGPKGPAGVIKPGALYLASKTGRPIVAVNVRVSRSIRIRRRWDRFEIPLPFSLALGRVSDPIFVRPGEDWEVPRRKIQEALVDL